MKSGFCALMSQKIEQNSSVAMVADGGKWWHDGGKWWHDGGKCWEGRRNARGC